VCVCVCGVGVGGGRVREEDESLCAFVSPHITSFLTVLSHTI
jgi:hypothetical protein